jgi:hypothetical protein
LKQVGQTFTGFRPQPVQIGFECLYAAPHSFSLLGRLACCPERGDGRALDCLFSRRLAAFNELGQLGPQLGILTFLGIRKIPEISIKIL